MLFCVHSYFFTRESTTFHLKFYPQAALPGTTGEGLTDVDPVILPNAITAEDFETFLWVFYNPCVFATSILCSKSKSSTGDIPSMTISQSNNGKWSFASPKNGTLSKSKNLLRES